MEIYNERVFDLLDLAGDHKSGLKVIARLSAAVSVSRCGSTACWGPMWTVCHSCVCWTPGRLKT